MSTNKPSSSSYLYLLAWHDIVERLDTLILEIRHLQVNIIHALREAELSAALRYEEHHLWATDWISDTEDCSIMEGPPAKRTAELAAKWVLLYPDPAKSNSAEINNKNCTNHDDFRNETKRIIEEALTNSWTHGCWGRDQRRYYHYLAGLQRLKREIFRDKLQICRFAIECGINDPSGSYNKQPGLIDRRAKFMVMRAGAMKRAVKYIKLMRNFQDAYGKSMDAGLQDHPRPSLERRRELGIYMDYLANRSRDLMRDMRLLLDKLAEDATLGYRRTKTILHRWHHDSSSRTEFMDNQTDEDASDTKETPDSIRFVNTSYYMPERPDLQPVIAHEIAHAVIRDQFDDLYTASLSNGGEFADLLATLRGVLASHAKWPGLPSSDTEINLLTRELACDLLAAAVKGFSYLYALFLEAIGTGMEVMLSGRLGQIELSGAYDLQAAPLSEAAHVRDWYLRLRLTTAWIREIHHLELDGPDKIITDGIDEILTHLYTLHKKLLPMEAREMARSRITLGDHMEDVLNNHVVTGLVKQWRKKRSCDDPQEGATCRQMHPEMPRSMRRLHPEVRDMLHQVTLGLKTEENRPLRDYKESEELCKWFARYYNTRVEGKANQVPESLYRHLYDIPWQCAILRAMDVLGSNGPDRNLFNHKDIPPTHKDLLTILHWDFSLGRLLHSVALEFHLWQTEPAPFRLSTVIGLIEGLIAKDPHDKKLDARLIKALNAWLGSTENNGTAQFIINKYKNTTPVEAKKNRMIERLAGRCLSRIEALLNDFLAKPDIDFDSRSVADLSTLRNYLHIHSEDNKANFYKPIKQALLIETTGECGKNKTHHHDNHRQKIESIMLGRLSLAGTYKTNRTSHQTIKNQSSSLINAKPMSYVFKLNTSPRGSCDNKNIRTQPLLGRYDSLIWHRTNALCRCPLPFFGYRTHTSPIHDVSYTKTCISEELRFPYFARREMAIAARLHQKCDVSDALDRHNFVALLSITLQRRPYRLDFLFRLLESINSAHVKSNSNSNSTDNLLDSMVKQPESLEQAAHLFDDNDFVLLTDGWGDLVIVFTQATEEDGDFGKLEDGKNGEKSRMERIFAIQHACFEDFQVDRTELILTRPALAWVGCQLHNADARDKWRIRTQFRLVEDRNLNHSNDEFAASVVRAIKKHNLQGAFSVGLYRTPGRMDYVATYEAKDPDDIAGEHKTTDHSNYLLNILSAIYESDYIDRTDTSISINAL